jgi:2-keto-4-pentenoate hydratase/2-oxohepta-3-ene-1,7-dioic acid hydratase in catechol pathway
MKNPNWNETKSQLNSQNYPISNMIFSAQELVSKISTTWCSRPAI